MNIESMALSCQYGSIGKILDYGVNDVSETNVIDLCMNNDITDPCKPDNIASVLNQHIGQTNAQVKYKKNDLWLNSTAIDKSCKDEINQLFVQYTCEHEESEMR